IIVREGHTITNEVYEELQLVGLLNEERNIYPVIGLSLLIILILGIVAHEMYELDRRKQLDKGKIASVVMISFIVVSFMKVISLFTSQTNQLFFVVPVATGVLLVKLLIHERLAIVFASLYAIIGSIIFNGEIAGSLNVEVGVYFFFSQMAAIMFLVNIKDRLAIVRSGIGISIVNMISVLLFLFLSFEKYSLRDLFVQLGLGASSALLSAILTIGLLPFFETGLGILSDTKLLQLSSPHHPLLRKILTEAPGTYHHSVMVANLSETACEAIGANGLLARVGAYYHDLGKTVRPHYFIENQMSIHNPHDVIRPRQSADIIISHPYDGANLLKKHKMPKEIIDIALQHHGTTLLKYFYYKEKEVNPNVTEKEYRYPGPKPQTKEAAIVCICDSVEAAVRSLKEPTEQEIINIVSSIVKDRLLDGQFDECPLTVQDLKVIHKTVCETLKGIFHSRIQYPEKEAK
ncbi:MAG TPA: HDIG domain-containing protein, partial [Bacillota bacterium]